MRQRNDLDVGRREGAAGAAPTSAPPLGSTHDGKIDDEMRVTNRETSPPDASPDRGSGFDVAVTPETIAPELVTAVTVTPATCGVEDVAARRDSVGAAP